MDFNFDDFDLFQGLLQYLQIVAVGIAAGVIISFLISLASGGVSGPKIFFRNLLAGILDFAKSSPRRMFAVADLTVKESVRKKALYAFVIFGLLFMFASWFLRNTGERPDLQLKVLVSFVLTMTSWLLLPVMLLLACWGLPTDIKNRSLHTVITKPARRSEVMLGRVLGYLGVGTFVLAIVGLFGYVFIVRLIPERAQNSLVSRVPVYGKLSFTDRFGVKPPPDAKTNGGVNVGDVWEFRSYIEGGTLARTYYDFEGLDVDNFKRDYESRKAKAGDDEETAALTLEYNFEAFRTHKGQMDQRLMARLVLINPDDETVRVPLAPFQVKEFSQYAEDKLVKIPAEIEFLDEETSKAKSANLFDDVMPDGKMIVEVSCIDPAQYLGMARPDLFIRTPDKPFATSFFKSIAGIWMQMFLVVLIGVTASCFVKGPVATLLTFAFLVVGKVFHNVMNELTVVETPGAKPYGGGPVESFYRMQNHLNMDVPLDVGPVGAWIIGTVDGFALRFLELTRNIIPNFGQFRMTEFTANGFDVPWAASMLPGLATTLAYIIPCILLGYFSLKLREMEAK